jgi:preprotein translocase subunit SecE
MAEISEREPKGFLEKAQDLPAQVKGYVAELRTEMRRVTWPTKAQVQSTTMVVIVTVFAFAAYFAVVDAVLVKAISGVQKVFTK